ncbi:sugar transferase [Bifidobacterium olomucense]|uniref:Exopolysaccharide biosynthesis polyprenyl glycosylphosphotransferase n=1 Tax=Bifidobacterium olomucense TaxID=2675324 RepID=A0A7Y0EVB3_9BIFI|nr:sugar transferase [Bifidobacterium sp. DSM 109959]NMM97059.1 exopolysaccharide biosynthesis polyprenyl glycosylphosphotransferase [Bifidobacterium sp. DSM 109959]
MSEETSSTARGAESSSVKRSGSRGKATGVRSGGQLGDIPQEQISHVLYWRFFINLALMLCDAAMFMIASAAVLGIRDEAQPFYTPRFDFTLNTTVYLIITAFIWVYSLRAVGIYHRHIIGDGYQINVLLVKGMVVCWVVQCAFNYFFNFDLTLTSLCLMVIAGWLLTMIERVITRMMITRDRRKGEYAYDTVVVGSPEGIIRTLKFLAPRQQLSYRPVAVCPIHLNTVTDAVESVEDIEALQRAIRKEWGSYLPVLEYSDHHLAQNIVNMNAQTVMVADELHRYSDNYNIFSVRMESMGLEIATVTSAADTTNHELQIRYLQGVTVVTQRLAQYTPARRLAKRLFDLVVSSLAILVSLIVTIPVAIAIKVTDGGPVFYKQTRLGLRGKPFQMYKFRSMVVNADELKAKLAEESGQTDRFIFKMKNDPRITKVGHFIRRFSIDELPQFLNVWLGDMSVVGPRPPLPEEYARYSKLYATRMLTKPGITGPWQVSGRSDLSEEESEALDVAYVQNWSITGDVVLLFRTVGAVLSHRGAY